jgi:hypothetical protein
MMTMTSEIKLIDTFVTLAEFKGYTLTAYHDDFELGYYFNKVGGKGHGVNLNVSDMQSAMMRFAELYLIEQVALNNAKTVEEVQQLLNVTMKMYAAEVESFQEGGELDLAQVLNNFNGGGTH